jgi:hypothetical protein
MTSISGNGATDIIYISEIVSGTISYRINNGSNTTISSWPLTVQNTNSSATLKVLFGTSITLTTADHYFIVGATNAGPIQFGSESLEANGTKQSIVIDGVGLYGGVFQNGTSGASGKSNVSIYNLIISAINGAYLTTGGGWIAQSYFGKDAINNYILNCSSDGEIAAFGGGIVGLYAAYKNTATSTSLRVIGCDSRGSIGSSAGGIVGARCGYGSGGSCTVEQCWSTGEISSFGGGIVGQFAAQNSGSITVSKCYSTGDPAVGNSSGGGICGSFAGFQSGVVAVEKSYSTGNIMQDGGGIYGAYAGDTSGVTTASNCYSSGTVATSGTGIFGSNKETGIATNCYSANGSWSDSTANTNLTGVPSGGNPGDIWASPSVNTPYELVDLGATPYQTLVVQNNALVQSKSQTVEQGSSSIEALAADASGNAFAILSKSGGTIGSYDTITISAQTGQISTTSQTAVGTYTLKVRSTGSYYITTFVLSVIAAQVNTTTTTSCCVSSLDERGLTYEQIVDYRIGNRLIAEHTQNPNMKFDGYSQFVKYKMAQGSRKV